MVEAILERVTDIPMAAADIDEVHESEEPATLPEHAPTAIRPLAR